MIHTAITLRTLLVTRYTPRVKRLPTVVNFKLLLTWAE